MRLNDVYYTTRKLDGIPEPPGQQPTPEFKQGEDIEFEVYLNYKGRPVIPEEWEIEAIVKPTPFAMTTAWKGVLNDGISKTEVPGFYKIVLKSSVTSNWLAGTYWMDVYIKEKLGHSNAEYDAHLIILTQPFCLNYSTASPNPGRALMNQQKEETYPLPFDPTKNS